MRISDWSSDVCSSDLAAAVEADIVIAEVVGDDQDDVRRALSLGSLRRALLPGDRAVWLNGIVPVLNYTGDAIFIRLEGPISARAGEEQCGEGRSDERLVGKGGVVTCSSRGLAG